MQNQSAKTIPWGQLPDASPGEFFCEEWNAYKRAMPRLLKEGKEGQFALIKGNELVGVYTTWDEARSEGLKRYLLDKHFIHRILRDEPLLRIRGI